MFHYDSPVELVATHLERWVDLSGFKIYLGEMLCGYRSMQNKYFHMNLLDIRTILILRRTQFNDTLSKWVKDSITEWCHMCQVRNGYSRGTLVHTPLNVILSEKLSIT